MAEEKLSLDEFLNSLTHGLGALAGLICSTVLITRAVMLEDVWRVVGVAIFGVTLVLLYTASTLYHSAKCEKRKAKLKVFDHSCIYLLIAGSFTPFALGPLRGPWGWSMFGVLWGLAIAGVIFKLFTAGRFNRLSTFLYLGMGWTAVIAIEPMLRLLTPAVLGWTLAGGLAYSLGTIFYMNHRIPFNHPIWHLFVLGGSTCHVVAIAML